MVAFDYLYPAHFLGTELVYTLRRLLEIGGYPEAVAQSRPELMERAEALFALQVVIFI